MMASEHLNKFIETAKASGCPSDQVRRFAQAGYIPQPKQLEYHAAARTADAPDGPDRVALGGARGPGKSYAILAQVGLDDCQRVDGLKALYLRKIAKSAAESFEDLITRMFRYTEHKYIPTRNRLEFPNGSRVLLGGFKNETDIDNYIGIEYDLIVLEEATTLTKLKVDMIEGSLRTSKSDWRPRMYLSSNPGGVGHAWFKQRFVVPARQGNEDLTRFIFSTYRDNTFLNPEYVRYLENLGGWLGKAWRDGNWDIAAGQFFTNWDHDKHVISPVDLLPEWQYWLALDYGYTHYTACYLMAEDGDGNIYAVDEHAERRWLPDTHAGAIKAMCERNGLEYIPRCVAGADVFAKRGTTQTIAEQYAEHGIPLERAQMDRINGAAKLLQYLGDPDQGIEQKLYVFDRCARLVECLPSLEHDPHRPEDVMKVDVDDDGNGGDDMYDALRYGLMETGSGVRVMPNPFYD